MKKLATLSTMAFLLATAGAFAQTPSTTTTTGGQATTKTTKTTHKGHKHTGQKPGTTAPTSAQK
jgi:hypothetical protein